METVCPLLFLTFSTSHFTSQNVDLSRNLPSVIEWSESCDRLNQQMEETLSFVAAMLIRARMYLFWFGSPPSTTSTLSFLRRPPSHLYGHCWLIAMVIFTYDVVLSYVSRFAFFFVFSALGPSMRGNKSGPRAAVSPAMLGELGVHVVFSRHRDTPENVSMAVLSPLIVLLA